MRSPYEAYGIQCHEGWACLYEPLIELCKALDIEVMQIKEKFGTLRFYIGGVPEEKQWVHKIIDAVTHDSGKICETCGVRNNGFYGRDYTTRAIVETKGDWLKTLCERCRKERDGKRAADDLAWAEKLAAKRHKEADL